MSNREKPHLLVLPEDRANAQIVNGFLLDGAVDARKISLLKEAGGWGEVLAKLQKDYAPHLRTYPEAHILLLIDFDDRDDRAIEARKSIPGDLSKRVFILGAKSTPEEFKKRVKISFEKIGQSLARDCQTESQGLWEHDLLKHNSDELVRLKNAVCPFVFSSE
jgi:hypothetical protein